jgi:hypothetical protein
MNQKPKCKCPYCENELEMGCLEPPFCKPCDVKLVKCKKCGKMFNAKEPKCPVCK